MNTTPPRIIIYGAGQFGQLVTQMAVDKGWVITAALNRAGDKIGQDIGRLAGLDKALGVIVQDCELCDYNNLDADIAIVAISDRLSNNMPAYQKLMSAGINVICHGTESYYPQGIDEGLANELDELGKQNNVTFTGSGIWDMSRIWAGMMVAATCTDISSFFHRSITDAQRVGKPLMLVVGVGMNQDEFEEKIGKNPGMVGGLYKTIPHQVLTALGYTVTKVTERREPVLFDEAIYCRLLERYLAPGECAGTRIVIEVETEEGVTARADIELRIFKDDEVEHMMWSVEGKPSAKITVERDDSAYMSAASMFNRIPDVIAAPAGLQVVSELGLMKPTAVGQ
jgi:secondary-alkyl amine dehydrogenase [NAD(P)+]